MGLLQPDHHRAGHVFVLLVPRSAPAMYGMALWLGYNAGIVPLLWLHPDRSGRSHEVAVPAAGHLLYGLVVGRLGGGPI